MLSYVFSSQCKEKGHALKGEGMVFAKVKAVGSVIVILHHLGSSTLILNLTAQNISIDLVYIEPNTWDICTRSPQSIDDIMRFFYNINSSTLIVQGCTHMIDSLAGKTKELIIMKSDPGMMSWLQK